jgi:hypothetical protein
VFAILFLKAPVALAMIMFLPLIPVTLLAVLNGIFLYDFGKAFKRPVKLRHYAVLFATQAIYQVVLNTAALWSVVRELRGVSTWYKTPHSGLHRELNLMQPPTLEPTYALAGEIGENDDYDDSTPTAFSQQLLTPTIGTEYYGDEDA